MPVMVSAPQTTSSTTEKHSAAEVERPKVVYVMGTGRSGSTILGITLGNCTDIFYAGELHLWLGKEGKSPLAGDDRARFWSRVREQVTPDLSGSEARSLEQTSAALRIGEWRAQRRLRQRYRDVAERLLPTIARTAEATHVVDSSHFPRRARELQALTTIDLYLLYLVRDPQSVVASYSRDDAVFPRFNLFTTNFYLWLTHLISLRIFQRHDPGRRLLVHYEAFVEDPETVLREIFDCIDSPAAVPDLSALDTGMAFQGNPVAKSPVVALNRNAVRPARRARLTTVLQAPWAAVFARLRPAATTSAAPARPETSSHATAE
jgi:hypothetical protein